jgi:hypothetical protein
VNSTFLVVVAIMPELIRRPITEPPELVSGTSDAARMVMNTHSIYTYNIQAISNIKPRDL